MKTIDRVSIVAPMLDEAEHVDSVVADVAAQDWDGELELLVADGGSADGSVELMRAAASRYGVDVTIFGNPDRWVSQGLNRCIEAATGNLIVRIDCHSRYPADYVRRCVAAAEETGADNVGGVVVAVGHTATERAVACAMDSPFGGIGWSRHGGDGRVEADTVPYGAFRPDVFRRVGLFDGELIRNQDDEFNLRLRRAGGKIVLDPTIRVFYTPRGTFKRLFRQYFEYGFWKPAVMRKHRRIASLRSVVPALFVATAIVLAALAPLISHAAWILALKLSLYAIGAVLFAAIVVRRRKESWRLLPRVIAVFPTLHVGHGLGMLAGWLRLLGLPRASGVSR